jgi:hypothetical protein
MRYILSKRPPVWVVDNIWPETVAFALAVGRLVNAEGYAMVN